jgi:hypothetical protein
MGAKLRLGWNSSDTSRVESELRKPTVNGEPKQNIWQRASFLCRRTASILKTGFGIICFGFLATGCGKGNGPATNVTRLGTNQIGLVSIGVLNTVNTQRQQAIVQFFASNGVACFIEGSVMFDVMVQQSDVERVHTILKTNPPSEVAFRSAWESR